MPTSPALCLGVSGISAREAQTPSRECTYAYVAVTLKGARRSVATDAGIDRRLAQCRQGVRCAIDDRGIADLKAKDRRGQAQRPLRMRHIERGAPSALGSQRFANREARESGRLGFLGERRRGEEPAPDRHSTRPWSSAQEGRHARTDECAVAVVRIDASAERERQPPLDVEIVVVDKRAVKTYRSAIGV